MSKTKIGDAAVQIFLEQNLRSVMWGDVDILDDIGGLINAEWKNRHPLDRHQIILNALDRDDRFDKGYIRVDIFRNNQSRRVRCFYYKDYKPKEEL